MAPSRLLLLPSVNAIRILSRPVTCAARPRFSFYPFGKSRSIVMANITKANFWETYEQLETQLKAAEFVALDFEMTGVETTPWRRHSEMDTCETRYQHIKRSAESFAVWQCGVCPFKWDEPGQKFIAYPYNFYIFPRNELPVEMTSRNYFCQTSSLEFLAKHNFDFNATVYNGISYLSMDQEDVARAKLGLTGEFRKPTPVNLDNEADIPLTRTADVVFSEKVRLQLGQWRDGVLRSKQQGTGLGVGGPDGSSISDESTQAVSRTMSATEASAGTSGVNLAKPSSLNSSSGEVSTGHRPSYLMDIFGNNQARLVKQVIRKHFQDLVPVVIVKPNSEGKQMRIVFTTSSEDKLKLMEDLEDENMRDLGAVLSKAVGFRKIIDAIINAGKPLVGHNCLLDLAHLHDKFLGPLPSNVFGFSASIHLHFPCVLDTKYLLKTEPTLREVNVNKSTSLAIVYQELCQGFSDKAGIPGRFYNGKPKVVGRPMSRVKLEIASELGRYSGGAADTGLKHEAGFDAYMTGAIFAQMCHILKVDVATIRALPGAATGHQVGFASYCNLLMLQTFKGQLALDLQTGTEAIGIKAPRGPTAPPYRLPRRENVALLWGLLPAQAQESFLRKMVQNIFSSDKRMANVDIYPIDGTSAFLEFRTSAVLEAFFQAIEVSFSAASLSTAADAEDGFSIKAARFGAYEFICSSPLSTESLGMAADLLRVNQLAINWVRNFSSKNVTEVQASLDQYLPSSIDEDETEDNGGSAAFKVGHWKEPSSSLLEADVVRRPESEATSVDLEDRIKPSGSLDIEEVTSSDVNSQLRTDIEEMKTNGIERDSDEGGQVSALESSYSKWMKRVFDDDDSGSPKAVSRVELRSPKRPRALRDKLGGRGAGSS